MDKKTPKTTTEELKFSDIWNNFKSDYLPFVEWHYDDATDDTFVVVEFLDNEPTSYVNKWGREQFKIRVNQDNEERILSAGKKLFVTLKKYCISNGKMPMDIGDAAIIRIGSGFDTDYKFQQPIPKKKT